jgi:hypothetical protein
VAGVGPYREAAETAETTGLGYFSQNKNKRAWVLFKRKHCRFFMKI